LKLMHYHFFQLPSLLETREAELSDIVSMKDSEISFLMNEKETEIQELGESLKQAETEKKHLEKKQQEHLSMLSECKQTITDMEVSLHFIILT